MHTKDSIQRDKDEDGNDMNPFAEMIRVMDIDHLIRFRRRLEKVGRKRMVEILSDEIEEREAIEKAEAQEARAIAVKGRK